MENLRKVLERCQEKNFVLNWEKCHFMVTQGIVLGHIVLKNGIEVDKAKVELISNLPTSKCVRDIRSFLGHVGFYRRFIKDFSVIARPLCNFLAKDVPFAWSQACEAAFAKLKTMLVLPPIMRSPNWNLPFEIMCDASDYAIGAVLGQREDKKAFMIYYASKTLDSTQENYTTTEKEFLPVIFALEKFRSYIVGYPVTIFTDDAALKYLLSKKDTKPWLMMSLKVIHFQSIFLIDFYLKNTDLCAEMWNNSPNCYATGDSREREYCSRRSIKWLSRTDTTGRRRLQQERCTRIKGPNVVTP